MRLLALIFIGLFLALPFGAQAAGEGELGEGELVEITVLADESLKTPLVELARLHATKAHVAVNLWFASTAGMIDAIRDGADADIVITADAEALKTLEYLGQLDVYATQSVATVPLVVAVRNDRESTQQRAIALEMMGLQWQQNDQYALVIISNPARVEHGMAEAALKNSEWLKDRNLRLIPASNMRTARRLMAEEKAPALLLASEVFASSDLQMVRRFPDSVVVPATYKAAVLAGEHMKESRAFLEALHTPLYRAPLQRYGLSEVAPDIK